MNNRTETKKIIAWRHSALRGFFLFLLMLVFCSLSCTQQKKDAKEVIVYLPKTISSIPLLELDKKTISGYTIKTVFFQDHIMAMAEFLTGKCDLFFTGTSQGASHYLTDQSIVHCVTIVWGASSLIAVKPELKTLADFVHKKIAVPFAKSPLDLQLRAIIAQTPDLPISIEYVPLQQAVPMMLSNQIDGVCLPEPQASLVIEKNNAHEVFYFPDEWARSMNADKRTPQVSLFAKKDFIKAHGEFIRSIIQSIKKDLPYTEKQEESLAEKYAGTFGIDKVLLIKGLHKTLFDIPECSKSIEVSKTYLQQTGFDPGPDDGFYFGY